MQLDWLKAWSQIRPHGEAIRCSDSKRVFTYKEMYEKSCILASVLHKRFRIQPGDRVAVLALNRSETILLFFALQRLSAILVPINFRNTAREVQHVLNDSEPVLFFYEQGFASLVAQLQVGSIKADFEALTDWITLPFDETIPMPSDESLPVMILYTSGTTGAPKGALIDHKMLFWNSINTALRLNITNQDKTIIFHPFFHTSGWNVLTTPFLHHGATIVLKQKFEAGEILRLAEHEKATVLFGVPTMMDMMAKTPEFGRVKLQVRYAIVGGEPMAENLIQIWNEKGVPIRQGFGLTEFGPNVFSLNEEDAIRKRGSIGFPNFYVETKVVDDENKSVKVGEVGELLLRGPMASPGYWRNQEATCQARVDSWVRTGDLVRFDEEGFYYVVGRKKEMYISGAENVYPVEVEQYLRTLQDIHEVAVVGVPDPKWGEVGQCFYSTTSGRALSDEVIRAHCALGLAKYKIPKSFHYLAELPKGSSGKILKRALLS